MCDEAGMVLGCYWSNIKRSLWKIRHVKGIGIGYEVDRSWIESALACIGISVTDSLIKENCISLPVRRR